MKLYYAGVGSRETPDDVLLLMIRLGRTLADLGYTLSSGDAIGADRAFWYGATLSPRHREVGCRIYLHKNGYQDRFNDPANGFLVAPQFTETWEKAQALASAARGGFYGLGPGGIALHTRNVFQVYGHTLRAKVKSIYYWAEPKGKQERVGGGTNTALQIAIKANLEQRINLYFPEMRDRALAFLAKYETAIPYPENILANNPWIQRDLPLPKEAPDAPVENVVAAPPITAGTAGPEVDGGVETGAVVVLDPVPAIPEVEGTAPAS